MITAYIFIFLAGAFNGWMDVLMWHFDKSVFKNLNRDYWNPNYSWKVVPNTFGIVRLDAWHLVKYGMLLCIAIAIKSGGGNILLLMLTWSAGFETTYKFLRK